MYGRQVGCINEVQSFVEWNVSGSDIGTPLLRGGLHMWIMCLDLTAWSRSVACWDRPVRWIIVSKNPKTGSRSVGHFFLTYGISSFPRLEPSHHLVKSLSLQTLRRWQIHLSRSGRFSISYSFYSQLVVEATIIVSAHSPYDDVLIEIIQVPYSSLRLCFSEWSPSNPSSSEALPCIAT